MNRFRLIIVSLMVAVLCMAVSCKGSGGDEPTPNGGTTNGGGGNGGGGNGGGGTDTPANNVKYLTAAEFIGSTWNGNQKDLNVASQLIVNDASLFSLVYYVKAAASSKNTGEVYKKVTVKVKPYTFDPATGKFSGTGDDGNVYSGVLTSKTSLDMTIPAETFKMDKAK